MKRCHFIAFRNIIRIAGNKHNLDSIVFFAYPLCRRYTVHTAQVTYAARDSEFDGYHILAGQYLGLLDGALVGSFDSLPHLLDALNDKIEALDPSLISVYYGEDIQASDAQTTSGIIEARFPDAEVMTINGGQPVYYYMISIE